MWRYFSDSVRVNVGIFLVCNNYCISNGVGVIMNSSSVFLMWNPLLVWSRFKDLVIGDLVQSWCETCVRFCALLCLANMYCINPLYIFPSFPLSLRALTSCSPIHVMYVFIGEKTYVSNILCSSCMRAFDIHYNRPHIDLCGAIIFQSSS